MIEVSLLIVYSQYLWIWQPCYADGFDLRARMRRTFGARERCLRSKILPKLWIVKEQDNEKSSLSFVT